MLHYVGGLYLYLNVCQVLNNTLKASTLARRDEVTWFQAHPVEVRTCGSGDLKCNMLSPEDLFWWWVAECEFKKCQKVEVGAVPNCFRGRRFRRLSSVHHSLRLPPRQTYLPSSASGVKCYSLLVVTVANHLPFCSNCFHGNGEIGLPGTERQCMRLLLIYLIPSLSVCSF